MNGLFGLGCVLDDDLIQIDRTTFNPARITKLYGTMAVKGDNTLDRPHRRSALLDIPDNLQPISLDVLRQIANLIPKVVSPPVNSPNGKAGEPFDIRRYLIEHGIQIHNESSYHDGVRFQLASCPFNPDHKAKDAAVFVSASRELGFRCLHDSCQSNDWHALRDLLEPGWRDHRKQPKGQASASQENENPQEELGGKVSIAAQLVAIGKQFEYFRSDRDEGFARIPVGGRKETWPLRSRAFRSYLALQFHLQTGKVPGSQAMEDALRILDANCLYDYSERPLAVRVAADPDDEKTIWIDLADSEWRAVRVTSEGWQIIADPPSLFRHYKLSDRQVLPQPSEEGYHFGLTRLRSFLNLRDENTWRLLIVWLIATFLPDIAHPVLIVYGEYGAAKSTLMRLLSRLVDPSKTPLRSEPGKMDEWVQMADHSWLITLDNLSFLPSWLSDAICRAVTGEGFSKRQLYTDNDDIFMAFRRVIALTGIKVVAGRADLLDRSLLMNLTSIPPNERRLEAEVLADFEQARPMILGTLLDILSGVLRELPHVQLTTLPRMADFARIGVAVERVLEWSAGTFLDAYAVNTAEQHAEVLSASDIGEAVCTFMNGCDTWEGSGSELLDALTEFIGEAKARHKDWPRTGRGLSSQLSQIAPNLRALGIVTEMGKREGGTGKRIIMLINKNVSRKDQKGGPSQSSPLSCSLSSQGDGCDVRDGCLSDCSSSAFDWHGLIDKEEQDGPEIKV